MDWTETTVEIRHIVEGSLTACNRPTQQVADEIDDLDPEVLYAIEERQTALEDGPDRMMSVPCDECFSTHEELTKMTIEPPKTKVHRKDEGGYGRSAICGISKSKINKQRYHRLYDPKHNPPSATICEDNEIKCDKCWETYKFVCDMKNNRLQDFV